MEKCKEEITDGNTGFTHSVQIAPEPIIIIASKWQLIDVERFSCNPASFCVLGVDTTLEMCNYYLIFAIYMYHNLILKTKPDVFSFSLDELFYTKPTWRGPITFENGLVSPCLCCCSCGRYQQGKSLAIPLLNAFNSATHLHCHMHIKDKWKASYHPWVSKTFLPESFCMIFSD